MELELFRHDLAQTSSSSKGTMVVGDGQIVPCVPFSEGEAQTHIAMHMQCNHVLAMPCTPRPGLSGASSQWESCTSRQ